MSYQLGRVPQIFAGQGSLEQLGAVAQSLGAKSLCFIADGAIQQRMPEITAGLTLAMIAHIIAPGEPTQSSVNAAKDSAKHLEHPCIVAIGGGSALDTGKQVAAILHGEAGIEHYFLCANPFPKRTPIIAIPTTAGTGAEVTRTCIVSDSQGRKLWTWGDEMLPDAVLLEPSLTASVPANVTAFTGLDAFVHALEAATGQRRNAISSGCALQAMRLIQDSLAVAVQNPNNLEARLRMQEAALLAGMAIDNCGTGIAHNIGHALGTLYHLPHGIAVTLALEAALPWNIQTATQEVFASSAQSLGTNPTGLIKVFQGLLEKTDFASIIKQQKPQQLEPEAILQAMLSTENLPMLNNNCRIPTPDECLELAKRTVDIWEAYRA
jgi:alcohol dehydrogenase